MKIKKYEVTDMKEALRQIKQDLGPEAVILTKRKIMKPSGLGLFPRTVLEVTAAVEYDKNDLKEFAANSQRGTPSPAATRPPQAPLVPEEPLEPVRSKPSSLLDEPSLYTRQATSAPAPLDPLELDDDEYIRSLLDSTDDTPLYSAPSYSPSGETESLLPIDDDDYYDPCSKPAKAVNIPDASGLSANQLTELLSSLGLDKISSLAEDIGEIKKQITVMKSTLAEPANLGVDLPPRLKEFYNLLTKNGFDELLCYRFLKNIERKFPELPGKAQLRNIIHQELSELIPIEKDFVSGMYRKVTAFIGPTGVGKTTTIAKIAANLVLKYTQRVCLITADNFRIGAVEQLKTYADIVNLPLYVTSSPEELRRLLEEIQSDYDYILLDTTGRSPYDNSKLNDIAGYLSVSADIIPAVVMSLAGNHAELSEMYERYTGLEPAYVIFTKLDETRYYGPLANIPIKKKVPLLLMSTGQGVPDDLEIPDGKKIAKKLLQEIPELWKEN